MDDIKPPADPTQETVAPTEAGSAPLPQDSQPVTQAKPKRRRKLWLLIALALIAALAAYLLLKPQTVQAPKKSTAANKSQTTVQRATGLVLDPNKNYGDKYKSGVLPVGDGKYSTSEAKAGQVYVCGGYARNMATEQGGAGRRGPWFSADGTTYDINKKAKVSGSVNWQSSFSDQVSGTTRQVISNGLPDHATGIYPIQASDAAAYAYDKNPNSIKSQSLNYALAASPAYGQPQCMGGQSGIMLTGAALFNGFDAAGRDAGAWEVQDSCDGHPEKTGEYHYHTLSACIKDTGVNTVIGFALDGFAITGPKVGPGNILTTADLDECHGITSQITLDGKKVTTYHYVMTQDFPYSVSCFRATPLDLHPAGSQQTQQGPPRQ